MAAVEQSAYENFRPGTEVDAMDMDEKIKGAHLRGKKYTVSQNGLCPRCGNSNRLYVILDKLFPMGDMPEILHTLMARGRAILWSSQEKEGYKDPPTFLCRGFCPSDPLGAGFNVNWGSVSVNEILESLDKPLQKAINPVSSPQGTHIQGEESSQDESSDNPYLVLDDFRRNESEIERNTSQTSVIQSSSDKEEENDEEEDEDDDELDEEELIKQMLAKEQQKLSQENKDDNDEEEDDNDDDDGNVHQDVSAAPTDSEDFSDQSALSNKEASSTAPTTASTEQMASSSTTKKSAASTAEQYPVSSTGHCPYCGSTDVKYIVVVSENTRDSDLPATLQQLLKSNHAFKMAKGNSEPPSFQCQKCQYGFNLNWSKTNLEIIFGLPPATSASTTPAASYTSTASVAYQTPPVAYTPYRGPSVPPPGYPPTVRVPPPVPTVSYQSYPPTYPGYYGSYYPSPPLPSAAGLYPPYSPPGIPPPGIPYPGVPPPGIPPPGIPPPRVPPPAIPPPRVPPPAVPPPMLPPPGIPSPGISPPGIPPPRLPTPSIPPAGYPPPAVPSRAAHPWGIYPQSQPVQPHFPTPLARRYPPPPGGRPYYPPLQQVRPPRPSTPRTFYQAAAHAAVSATTEAVPTQQVISAQQDAGGKNNGVAAARFEMVLNQIDLAKARVRHEKEQMKEFQKAVHGNEMGYQEPNAVTEDELRPPGDEDTGFDYNIIIPGSSLEQEQVTLESSVTPDTAEHSVLPPQVMDPAVSEHPKEATAPDSDTEKPDQLDVTARETEAGVRDVVESSVVEADDNSNKDQNADDDGAVPEVVEAAPKTAVATRGGRSGRSKKQEKLPSPPTATSTRQTRRSRRSEPAATTEDTDSTAAEEEAVAVTGRSRRSRKTKPLSKEVERMDIRDEQEEGLEATDVEMGESSDVLSQSSVVPQTESDSTQEAISESFPSSSEPDTVFPDVARPQRGRQTRGRKRKQEAAVAEASSRKSRRMVAEEQLSEDKDEDEDIVVENSTVVSEKEDTEIAATSLRVGRSRRGASGRQVKPQLEAVDTTEESNTEQEEHESTAVTQVFDKQNAKMRTQRQTRKSAHLPEEAEAIAAGDSITSPQTKATSVTTHEEGSSEAEETTKNRQARRSAPISLETDESVGNRRKRKSAQLSSQESELSDTELQVNSDDVPKIDAQEVKSKATVFQQEEKKMQSVASPADHEEKPSRRTRKTRKSSEGDDASGPQEVLLTLESDSLIPTEEAVGNRQTRSRKSPTVRSKVQTIESNTSALEENKRTTGKRKSRKSLGSNEDTTNDDVELSVEPATPEEVVSSRQRKRRNKSNPSVQENTELSQASDDLSGEHDVEEEASVAPQRKVAKKMAPVQSPETVTKRVTRARQRK